MEAQRPEPGLKSSDIIKALDRGEDGDAELYIQKHRERFCYDHADRRWYEFKRHFWRLDRCENALAAVSEIIDIYATEARNQGDLKYTAFAAGEKEMGRNFTAVESRLLKRVMCLHTAAKKANVLTLAAAGDGTLGIAGLEWDRGPYLLGCPNGVLDLKTGRIRDGLPSDYIKTVTAAEWQGIDAPCPTWERFIDEVFAGDSDMIAYMQTLLGYGLIGDTPLHVIPIFWGRGRNGKGTLLETVKCVLGAFAYKAEAEMLLDQKAARASNAHNSGVLALQGKRLVWTSEVDEGRRFNAAKVKELVGGDTLSGRAAYGRDHKEFRPSHLLIMLTNAKPAANPSDYALWKRIHLIEFGLSFVENPTEPNERQADPDLPEKLKAEVSGILAWMVRGCLRFQQQGLQAPDKVRAAVARYRGEEDILGHFITERCIEIETAEVSKGALYRVYKEWCDENGHSPLGSRRFYNQVNDRFDSYDRGGGRFFYTGIGLLED